MNRQTQARALLDKLRAYLQRRLDEPGEVPATVVELFITWDQLNQVIENDPAPHKEPSPHVARLLDELGSAFDEMIAVAENLEKRFPPEQLKKIVTARHRFH